MCGEECPMLQHQRVARKVVKAAQRSVGVSLPTTMDIYTSRCRKRAACIMKDPTHPAHSLFVPLPSGRRLRSIKCKTNRQRNSFITEAYCHNLDRSTFRSKDTEPSTPCSTGPSTSITSNPNPSKAMKMSSLEQQAFDVLLLDIFQVSHRVDTRCLKRGNKLQLCLHRQTGQSLEDNPLDILFQ
ncbi:hypothetical protein NFI96_000614 [Prochilodus magdalenae]|nr:hypothetical protein NFI96_000614 [Prochilodus magdalenae]